VTAILEASQNSNQPVVVSPTTSDAPAPAQPQQPHPQLAGNLSSRLFAEGNSISIPPFTLDVDETPKPKQPAPLSTPALARRLISSSILYSPIHMSPAAPAINLFGAKFAAMTQSSPAPSLLSVPKPQTDASGTPSRASEIATVSEMAAPKRPPTRVRLFCFSRGTAVLIRFFSG
jgi:hypothetical protein